MFLNINKIAVGGGKALFTVNTASFGEKKGAENG